MQQGSIIRSERKHGPAVWQFRWSETGPQGQRVYRKRVVGTVEEYANSEAVRESVKALITKPSPADQTYEATDHDGWRIVSAFRATGIDTRRYLAQLFDEKELLLSFEVLDHPSLGEVMNSAKCAPLKWSRGCADWREQEARAPRSGT